MAPTAIRHTVLQVMALPSNVIKIIFLLDMEYLDVQDMSSGITHYQHVKVSFDVSHLYLDESKI